jgi:hypothetical protein
VSISARRGVHRDQGQPIQLWHEQITQDQFKRPLRSLGRHQPPIGGLRHCMAATRQDMTQGVGDAGSSSMTGIAVVHAGLGDRTSSLGESGRALPPTRRAIPQRRRSPVRDGSRHSACPCTPQRCRGRESLRRVSMPCGEEVAAGEVAAKFVYSSPCQA